MKICETINAIPWIAVYLSQGTYVSMLIMLQKHTFKFEVLRLNTDNRTYHKTDLCSLNVNGRLIRERKIYDVSIASLYWLFGARAHG